MRHPENFDKTVAATVAKLPKKYYQVMRYVSILGGAVYATIALAIIFGVALINSDTPLLKYSLAVAFFIPLAEILKIITRRPRPDTIYAKNMKFKSYSFPSGHAYVSALISGFIAVLSVIHYSVPIGLIITACAITFSAVIGISRVYLGAHFPSDVVAGWSLGAIMISVITTIAGV